MIRSGLSALIVLFAAASAVAQTNPDAQALAQAANGFYGVYLTLHPSDGVPDAATRAKFAPFVSSTLDRLFADSEAAEDAYGNATKHQAPPLLEGDIFTPNFEGATSFKVGLCQGDATGGHCAIALRYDDRKDKPLAWTDTAYFVRIGSDYRLDDIAYGGNWDFGSKGGLVKTLKSAIADGASFSK